jgi:hypothetical protein
VRVTGSTPFADAWDLAVAPVGMAHR